jgi:dolichol-phosphate mannosyltransferase
MRPESKDPMTTAVVIPSYRVRDHIIDVIQRIGPEVQAIYVVDDCCPEGSGAHVQQQCNDPRVKVIKHEVNQGVGGATMSGYQAAITDGHAIIVKVDGDGQMSPELIPQFIAPIREGLADYTKGNRFYDLTHIGRMPAIRLIGNAALSFMSKFSSGYWEIFDPTNGFTAIHAKVASHLPMDRISKRYFFESDMLFRLNTMRCVVMDIPMDALYAEEVSNLRVRSVLGEFLGKHLKNFGKRIIYNYFLRDMSAASLYLVLGLMLSAFGSVFGLYHWMDSAAHRTFTAPGTVMLAALPLILGLQFLLAFLMHDTQSTPRIPLHTRLFSARQPLAASTRMETPA